MSLSLSLALLAACSAGIDPVSELGPEPEFGPEGAVLGQELDASERLVGDLDDPTLRAEQLCGGAIEAVTLGIEPPAAPVGAYGPGEAPDCNDLDVECDVFPATLQDALDSGARVIVLEDGIYPPSAIDTSFLRLRGRELWAKNPGGAVLEIGIEAGGNDGVFTHSGGVLRGLVFDVDDDTHVPVHPASGSTIVSAWGDATDLRVEDCVFHGNQAIEVGIYVTSAEGLELRRLEIDSVFSFGALVEGQGTVTTPVIAEDIWVEKIGNHPTGAPTGIGLRMGETASVSRVQVRDVRWAGIVINGDSDGSVVSDVDLDRIGVGFSTGGVGVYLDNTSLGTTVHHFCVGGRTRIGVNSEWDHWCDAQLATCDTPAEEMFSRAYDSLIEDGLIESSYIGVHFDQGTVNGHVEGVTFRNYEQAGIDFFHNLATGDVAPNWSANGSTQTGNTFPACQVADECEVTDSHWNSSPPNCLNVPVPC